MYKIIKIKISETKDKYVLLKQDNISLFVNWLIDKKNINIETINISIWNLTPTTFPVMEKYCLFEIDKWKSIEDEINKKWMIQLKKNIEKFISGMFHEKQYVVLEPKYNEIINERWIENLFQNKDDIKSFINKYVIMNEYFKILKSDNVWIHYIIKNNIAYIKFEAFNFDRNKIKSFNKNKKLLKLSLDNFIPYIEYKELDSIILKKDYKSIRDMFNILNNQEIEKSKLVYYFFNYFIKAIYWDNGRKMKVQLLNMIPSYKNHTYNKSIWKNFYTANDKTLDVYINYNKTLFFYKPLKKLIDLVIAWNSNSYQSFLKNYLSYIKIYIKWNNFEKVFYSNVMENFYYLAKNYKDYELWIESIIEKWIKDKTEIFKELKKLWIESKNNFTIYSWYDLGSINNSKQISKILKLFKDPEYNEM